MPRPHPDAYDLTDAEKRDLIELIKQGKPLPEKYRFLLFADKREVELVWNGKSREVCTAILPFQTLEHIDEPRKEKRDDEELGLDTGGRQVKGWINPTFYTREVFRSGLAKSTHFSRGAIERSSLHPATGKSSFRSALSRGGGCSGNASFSCCNNSRTPASGCV